MKKRRFLLAVLFVCFSISLQEANAQEHKTNTDVIDDTLTEYNDVYGGALNIGTENTNKVSGSTFDKNTATNSGGAVYNTGTLNVEGSKFEENSAIYNRYEGKGGAIYNSGDITINNSSFSNNKAGSGLDWQENSHGGAVYNAANAVITNSTFTGNRAKYGGAIYNDTNGTITVGGQFISNSAQTGGAIENDGGKLTVNSGSLFEDNTVSRFDGGAIFNEDGTLNIEDDVIFKNNRALEGDEKRGGAIFSEGEGKSKVQIGNGVTFEGNKAKDGGAIDVFKQNNVTIGDNAVFKNNQAQFQGGAISSFTIDITAEEGGEQKSSFKIGDNALFEGNQAGFDDSYSSSTYVTGGAISVCDTTQDEENHSSFSVGNNATFRNNKAISTSSGISGYGGAIYNDAHNTTVGDNALFENNMSNYGGAVYNQKEIAIGDNAVFNANSASYGGAFYNSGNNNIIIGKNALFIGNNSSSLGGAIYNYNGIINIGENAVFDGNRASMGGAVYNYVLNDNENSIQKAAFGNNEASYGGAIYNHSGTLNISDSAFYNNNAASESSLNSGGGALYNQATVKVTNSLFENNITQDYGGAVYNVANNSNPELTVEKSGFSKNQAMVGGAIAASGANTQTTVSNSAFQNNYAAEKRTRDASAMGGQGGAIWSGATSTNTVTVENSSFENNKADAEGGAIWSGGKTTVTNSLFKGNTTTGTQFTEENPDYNNDKEGGGAIFVGSSSQAKIEKSDFINNSSATVGGAIATRSNASGDTPSLTVTGSNFSGNTASKNGGAIASYTSTTLTDTSFVNNKANGRGGAIWANGDVTVKADESDVVFYGNSAEDGGDIYMDKLSSSNEVGSLKLQASEDKNITIADGISGADTYDVTLDGAGTVTFNSEIKNANMQVTKGTLHLAEGSSLGEGTTVNVSNATLDSQDGKINDYGEKVKIGNGSKIKFDVSSAAKTTDKFSQAEGFTGDVKIEDFNFLPDTTVSNGNITSEEIRDSLGLGEEVVLELPEKSFTTLTPLRYLNVQSGAEGISYTPTGNTFRDFNPAVTAAPVAAQLGGYLTQLDSYDEAFRNMDMYMIMPKSMRQAMKYKNKYAQAGSDLNYIYDKSSTPYESTALWARPYATFENVRLKNGPKVSNVSWGTYLGGDSELFDLKNGWEGMWSLYAGYNGSHQAYNGVSIYQNGGTLGLTGTLYKNNFFTGLTANVGANSAEASTGFGDDSFGLFRTGVASKTGYNLELADGKFIIQPSWLMSYSFVNTEDYTTSNGIRVNSNPLNVMHLEPGLKFIGNVGNGWQPYTGLSIVWNLFDKTDFVASDATLPELSIKPFFRYGVGLRKLCGERFVGYGQTYFTSGGRNGVGLQFGGRWSI